MKQEVKQLWIDALRSGEYEQTKGYLKRETAGKVGYCCLGVLCDLAIKNGVELSIDENEWGGFDDSHPVQKVTTFNGASTMLPDEVAKWAGLDGEDEDYFGEMQYYTNNSGRIDGALRKGYNRTTLWELNDDDNMPFDQIADVIDKEF